MAAMLNGKSPKDCLSWEPERGTNFLIINKHTGKPTAAYKGAACFAFHHINAYEQDGNLVVDIAATDEPEFLRKSYLKTLRAATRSEDHSLAEYRRYCLPLATSEVGQLVKVDVEKRTSQTWFEPNTYPSEPIFVAAPNATREDDGVILSVVLDTARGRSFLLVLDATRFRELGRAHLPHHIPLEFHGLFIKDGQ
jgi:carotenoid cleavage dioxygenase-like enzyme